MSCKYLLKAVPYYGEKSCEEQHEKSLETCENTLTVTPQHQEKTCEEPGAAVIHKSVIELREKAHTKVNIPIVHRTFKVGVAGRWGSNGGESVYNRYARGGSWKNISAERRQTGVKKVMVKFGWRFENKPVYSMVGLGTQSLNPSIVVKPAEYRVEPIIKHVQIRSSGWFRHSVHEDQHTGWRAPRKTSDRELIIPNSMFAWSDGSPPYARDGAVCSVSSERCIDRADKTFYGVRVSKPCWKKEITYSCRYPSKNNCKPLLDKGCSQTSSVCLKRVGEVCVNYQKTFDCLTGFSDSWSGCESFVGRPLCRVLKEDVLEGKASKLIAGKDISRDCWKKKISYSCAYPAPNDCEALRLPSCKQIKEKCLKTVNGVCVVMSRTYKCVDGVNDGGYTTNCQDLEKKALAGICERVSHDAGSKQAKSVDGFKYEGVWERTSVFKCQHPSKNNCAALIATGCCKVKSTRCKKTVSGTCVVWEKELVCGEDIEDESSIVGAKVLGLGGELRGDVDINDSNIGESIAQLTAAKEAGEDGAGSKSPTVFKGRGLQCTWGPTGANNCCRISGWGQSIGFVECNSEEEQLAHLRKKKYCVPVGSYCSFWCNVPYKHAYCITRKNSYCCFKGKLARLIQVEGRKQLGIGWGSAKHPDCRALTMKEFSRINFNKIDFSEIHPDVLANFKKHDATQIKKRMAGMVRKQMSQGSYKRGK